MDVNGGRSERRRIPVGVFQGSIAGPILFIVFFNDLVTLQDALAKISIYLESKLLSITKKVDYFNLLLN